jgi:hypothetical protein
MIDEKEFKKLERRKKVINKRMKKILEMLFKRFSELELPPRTPKTLKLEAELQDLAKEDAELDEKVITYCLVEYVKEQQFKGK